MLNTIEYNLETITEDIPEAALEWVTIHSPNCPGEALTPNGFWVFQQKMNSLSILCGNTQIVNWKYGQKDGKWVF